MNLHVETWFQRDKARTIKWKCRFRTSINWSLKKLIASSMWKFIDRFKLQVVKVDNLTYTLNKASDPHMWRLIIEKADRLFNAKVTFVYRFKLSPPLSWFDPHKNTISTAWSIVQRLIRLYHLLQKQHRQWRDHNTNKPTENLNTKKPSKPTHLRNLTFETLPISPFYLTCPRTNEKRRNHKITMVNGTRCGHFKKQRTHTNDARLKYSSPELLSERGG